jgi:hypothetical protein
LEEGFVKPFEDRDDEGRDDQVEPDGNDAKDSAQPGNAQPKDALPRSLPRDQSHWQNRAEEKLTQPESVREWTEQNLPVDFQVLRR